MSPTIAEIAEREALEAEAEEGTEPTEPEPTEPEPEPEPEPAPASDTAIEKRYAALDKEGVRHSKRVAEIMGDDFTAVQECPCCQIPGFVFPFDLTSVEDAMRRGNTEAYFGTAAVKLKRHPSMTTCDLCDGHGFLDTGGKREGYTQETCERCGGQGWTRTDTQPQNVHQIAPPPVPAEPGAWSPPGAPPKPELYYDYSDGTWKIPA